MEREKSRLDEVFAILDELKNRVTIYDDQIIRQILECVAVESKGKVKAVFVGGTEAAQTLR